MIRGSAVAALVIGTLYLGWRLTGTLNGDAITLSAAMWVLEVHAWAGLALFTFSLWDVDATPTPLNDLPDLRAAVLIPTYDEPVEILLPTVAAALALQPAHDTWVLDDGDRPHVAALAHQFGARYLARADRTGAKAGNINDALPVVEADLVAILDADHVPAPDFLLRTLPYFTDPDVALVQTPQDFYNETSFEHVHVNDRTGKRASRVYSEQAVFNREIQPGKNRWNGALWSGTGAVVRVAALDSVGGVATSSVAEGIQTTIWMHRRGWRTVYHDEVLARGLAASTAAQYSQQRHRWCTGAMQVLREERPLSDRRLGFAQRLSYAATLLGWFDAVRVLGFLVLPPAVLLSGASPIDASLGLFVVLFVTWLAVQQHALWRLARGRMRLVPAAVFDLVRLEPTLRAIVGGLRGRELGSHVTPERGTRTPVNTPTSRLLTGLLAAHVVAGGWYALNVLGHGPLTYGMPGVAHGAAFWMVINASLLAMSIRRVRSERFAAERRASHRHAVTVDGTIDGKAVTITDLSLTGAQAIVPESRVPAVGTDVKVFIPLDLGATGFRATVRSMRPDPTRTSVDTDDDTENTVRIGLEFHPHQLNQKARLTLGLFAASSQSRDDLGKKATAATPVASADAVIDPSRPASTSPPPGFRPQPTWDHGVPSSGVPRPAAPSESTGGGLAPLPRRR
ncbi:MAG: glycosyltransferase [Acidimicrobiales bacterium]|nr:glycosyltransferase [Acidimicrobiales bacterium]